MPSKCEKMLADKQKIPDKITQFCLKLMEKEHHYKEPLKVVPYLNTSTF